jgi:hypothetical protein
MTSSCSRLRTCPLFRAFSIKSSAKIWRAYYCEGDFERCERWRLAEAGKPVPVNLLPNGRLLDVPIEQLEAKHTG